MKRRIGISLIWALLIVVSTFTVLVDNIKGDEGEGTTMPIDVYKKVWDGNDWAETLSSHYGETVRFNITITYHKNCENGMWASDVIVNDTLPSFLQYVGNTNYEPSFFDDNLVSWSLSEDYGIYLENNSSISLEFDTEVIEYGEDVNFVEVTAYEAGCGWFLYGEDDAAINIVDPLVVEKEVYNPDTGEWIDDLLGPVKKVEPIKFRITVTYIGYYDVELMKTMIVEDFLPECCLEYADNEKFTYPDDELFDDPDITVSQDLKYVKYDWTNKKFNLFAGESIVIEFETSVVEYSYDTVINCVYVDLWNWPTHISDSDCATVNCFPPDTIINKKVWDTDGEEWVEEISVYIDDIVTFGIDLTYYGNYNLSGISILDQLHISLEYEGNANPPHTDVSGNLIWWNFTGPLYDSETLSIEFEALAVGGTGSGPGINIVFVTAYEQSESFEDCDTAGIIVKSNIPPSPPDVTGDTYGEEGQELTFKAIALDLDGNDLYYMFDWGDETYSDWLGPYHPDEEVETYHSWNTAGEYEVKAKAKDDPFGEESDWSFYPAKVEIVEPPLLSLNVSIKRGLGLYVSIKIENDGEAELNNIEWNLTIKRLGIFKRTLWTNQSVIPALPAGEKETLTGYPTGYGMMNITVQIEAPDIAPIEVSAQGLIFWRFIWVT